MCCGTLSNSCYNLLQITLVTGRKLLFDFFEGVTNDRGRPLIVRTRSTRWGEPGILYIGACTALENTIIAHEA